jgi:hypothetical protein
MLPTFIIAGPPKAGTSSLQYYIRNHPQIYVPEGEPHFFCDHFEQGLKYYSKFFEGWSGQKAVGEKTPCYFYMPEIPKRIKEYFPGIKLLFIYRNPIERAYSQYWHNVRRYVEFDTFDKAIKREIDGVKPIVETERVRFIYDREPGLFSYLSIGRYAEHIERWKRCFDKSQMFHMVLEDLDKATLRKVLEFLEVDSDFEFGELKKFNVGGSPRSLWLTKITRRFEYIKFFHDGFDRFINFKRGEYPPMNQKIREFLGQYFIQYNKEFERLTSCSAGNWR